MNDTHNSQLSKFYKRSLQERRDVIQTWVRSGRSVGEVLDSNLRIEQADSMVENAIGVCGLPLGIATNFLINGRDYLVPMVIEEPSVIAAASHAAKLFREGGGFHTSSDAPVMIGQIQILDVPNLAEAVQRLAASKAVLIAKANEVSGSILKRGGGVIDLEIRVFEQTEVGPMVVVHLLMDTRDAMGANAINTAVEYIASDVAEISGGRTHLRILSNLTDRRKAKAWGVVPASALATENKDGHAVIKAIVEASVFAEVDPYRAATHNKGVMNGIDAVVIATGNDWRAVEAGAHAFAARRGAYTSLSTFRQNETGDLYAEIELPLAVGVVGGATRVHPVAQLALEILGVTSAQELAEIIVAVGLAQNFAAVKALAGEGIQKGHMRMHARQIAMAAGATVEMVPTIVETLIRENNIRLERATALVKQFNETEQDKR